MRAGRRANGAGFPPSTASLSIIFFSLTVRALLLVLRSPTGQLRIRPPAVFWRLRRWSSYTCVGGLSVGADDVVVVRSALIVVVVVLFFFFFLTLRPPDLGPRAYCCWDFCPCVRAD